MTANSSPNIVETIQRLGFSEMEAEIYCELLRSPGATGYGIGKEIRKPHANVYQGLTALEAKGAVLAEYGDKMTYTAVPPTELLDTLRRRSEREFDEAARALDGLKAKEPRPERFYHLKTAEQVYTRARALLKQAEKTVLVEAFPGPAQALKDDLAEAAARGIAVAGLVLREADLVKGANTSVSQIADSLLAGGTGERLSLVVDGNEFVLALFDSASGDVVQAIWAKSDFVGAVMQNGLTSDTVLHRSPLIKEIGSPDKFLWGKAG